MNNKMIKIIDNKLNFKIILFVIIIYIILTLIFTYPAVTNINDTIIGDSWDGSMYLWTFWWNSYSIFELGKNPFYTNHLFYPEGTSLVFHTHNFFPSLIFSPLQYIIGLIPAFNIMMLSTFILSGFAMFLLSHYLTKNIYASIIAGTVFCFGHLRISMILFPDLMHSYIIVFFIWILFNLIDKKKLKWSITAGITASIIFYTSYNLFVFTIVISFIFFIYNFIKSIKEKNTLIKILALYGTALLIMFVLISPLLVLIIKEILKHGNYTYLENRPDLYNIVPLIRWITYGPIHGMKNNKLWHVIDSSFIGYTVLLLILTGIIFSRKTNTFYFWIILLILGFILIIDRRLNISLDPENAQKFLNQNIPMPYEIITKIPIIKGIANAHRWGIIGWIGCSVLTGFGISFFINKLLKLKLKKNMKIILINLSVLILLLLVFIDFARLPFPISYTPPKAPDVFKEIKKDTRNISILEFNSDRLGDPRFCYYETVHKKPVYLSGSLARINPTIKINKMNSLLYAVLFKTAFTDNIHLEKLDNQKLIKKIKDEIKINKIGWVIISWDNWMFHSNPSHVFEKNKIPGRMENIDYVINKFFEVEKTVFTADDNDFKKWADSYDWKKRREMSCIYKIYKIKLIDE